MSSQLTDKRTRCSSQHADHLINFLQKKLAPLLFKIKPACLLGLSYFEVYNETSQCMLWTSYKCQVMSALGLTCKEMGSKKNAYHILFYRPELLQPILDDCRNKAFLASLGYGPCQTLEEYIALLASRFKSKTVPHEIGLFLGYPLHDVKKFIEGNQLPLFPKGRWLVYEQPNQAIRIMALQKKAEQVMEKLLAGNKRPEQYIDKMVPHFIRQAARIQMVGS